MVPCCNWFVIRNESDATTKAARRTRGDRLFRHIIPCRRGWGGVRWCANISSQRLAVLSAAIDHHLIWRLLVGCGCRQMRSNPMCAFNTRRVRLGNNYSCRKPDTDQSGTSAYGNRQQKSATEILVVHHSPDPRFMVSASAESTALRCECPVWPVCLGYVIARGSDLARIVTLSEAQKALNPDRPPHEAHRRQCNEATDLAAAPSDRPSPVTVQLCRSYAC